MMGEAKKLRMLLPLTLCFAVGPLLARDAGPMAGRWKLQDNVAGIQKERNCVFTQKGATFAGTCRDADGPVSVAGKVNGDKVSFQFKVDVGGQTLTIACSGALKAGSVSGSVVAQPLGIPGDFTLTRPH